MIVKEYASMRILMMLIALRKKFKKYKFKVEVIRHKRCMMDYLLCQSSVGDLSLQSLYLLFMTLLLMADNMLNTKMLVIHIQTDVLAG